MKKILLFDLDHTLWDFDLSEQKALKELFLKLNVEGNKINEYIKEYEKINKKMWEDYEKGLISKKELANTRFEKLFSHFNKKVDGIFLSRQYAEILGKYGDVFTGCIELLEKLKSDFYIYAATNGIKDIQRNRLKNSNISKYFLDIFISDEIGYSKPDIKFFEYILNKLKVSKENVLMIGDNLNADIKGAINANISSIWYNKSKKENTLLLKTIEVYDYDELLEKIYDWNK